jgi:hypothetical protein
MYMLTDLDKHILKFLLFIVGLLKLNKLHFHNSYLRKIVIRESLSNCLEFETVLPGAQNALWGIKKFDRCLVAIKSDALRSAFSAFKNNLFL